MGYAGQRRIHFPVVRAQVFIMLLRIVCSLKLMSYLSLDFSIFRPQLTVGNVKLQIREDDCIAPDAISLGLIFPTTDAVAL